VEDKGQKDQSKTECHHWPYQVKDLEFSTWGRPAVRPPWRMKVRKIKVSESVAILLSK
jgi:hypothetical protein